MKTGLSCHNFPKLPHVSKERSITLKAIAILFVLISHLLPPFLSFHEFYIPIKRFIGQIGVNIFLFISGYGLYVTYIRGKISPRQFLVKRFSKLWPLYIVSLLSTYLFQILIFKEQISWTTLLIHFTGLQVYFGLENQIYSILHFISVITVAYLFTFLSLLFPEKHRLAILGSLLLLHAFVSLKFYGNAIFVDYLASFSMGLLWADRIHAKEFLKRTLILLLPPLFLFLSPHRLSLFILTIFVIAIFLQKNRAFQTTGKKSLTIWLGTNSYLIYLGHNYFASKWPQMLQILGERYMVGVLIIFATSLWFILLFYFNKFWNNLHRG